jgi:O-antigen/teichoic acid export membrane protein
VNEPYLLLVLPLILLNLLFAYGQNILLGMQKIKKYNLITLGKNGIFLGCILVSVILFKSNIAAIILANVSAMCLSNALLLVLVRNSSKGAKFEVNRFYIKDVLSFGIKAHLGHILSFLNYRVDMLLINGLLNPTAVGFYSISVVIAEKLWWISQAASTVLFPQVASERDERIRKEITPIVSRNVLFVSLIGTVAIFFLSRWLVSVLYSNTFLPAVRPLQALLPGIVALSVSRVLANDIAGRGRPILNAYLDILTVATNVACNIWWIPRFGIEGAAWATTVSYSVHLVGRTLVYSKLSGNPIHKIFLLTSSDIILYKRVWLGLMRRWSSAWSR